MGLYFFAMKKTLSILYLETKNCFFYLTQTSQLASVCRSVLQTQSCRYQQASRFRQYHEIMNLSYLYSLYLKSAVQNLTKSSHFSWHFCFIPKNFFLSSKLLYFYSNMPDILNFMRKHVFNFKRLNMVFLIRMRFYECIRKKEAWKLYFF